MTWYLTRIQLEFVDTSMEIIAIYDKHVILKMIHFFIGNLYLLLPIFDIFKTVGLPMDTNCEAVLLGNSCT
jgi:hypothetical protein